MIVCVIKPIKPDVVTVTVAAGQVGELLINCYALCSCTQESDRESDIFQASPLFVLATQL